MMATMKKYFTFGFTLECGIPQVTIEGTDEDWKLILARIEDLKNYGSQTTAWLNLLRPVISRFVSAFEAPDHPDNLEFWCKVASRESEGSGSACLSGWVNAFCVFDVDGAWLGRQPGQELKNLAPDPIYVYNLSGKRFVAEQVGDRNLVLDGVSYHRVDLENIPTTVAEVDVELDDNGTIFQTKMIAGLVGYQVSNINLERIQIAREIARPKGFRGLLSSGLSKSILRRTEPQPPNTSTEIISSEGALLKPLLGWWLFIKHSGT
ncbi:hypothetical protein BT96DRAFT_1025415 [Gymnopus androsaceus JB14]|uniref:Uncharacterized protein n=1 Tax=Gymnopus androsaceus JB14 TaxID=1447944 RepID=A0A6A4GSZ1_9AGAR|nr:hypothetical protein BT96DRAFT_1025415 [Gymnopus androsaceus JB14]